MRRAFGVAIVLAILAAIFGPFNRISSPTPATLQLLPRSSPAFPPPAGPVFSPPIRVCLTPTPVDELALSIDGPYELRALGGAQVLARGERLPATTVTTIAGGLRIGRTEHRTRALEIVAKSPPAIWVGDHQYRGNVRLFRQSNGRILAVNVLPVEQYLASVVDSEMPIAFGEAARQAQSIVARTYAHYRRLEARGHPHFEVYNTSQSQRYLGFQYRASDGRRLAGESESSRTIVASTAAVVCTWDGKLFSTYYSACCGGRTTQGDRVFTDAVPALKSVPCQWCSDAKLYRWTESVPKEKIAADLRDHFSAEKRPFGTVATLRLSTRQDPVGVPVVEASDGRNRHPISAATLRRQLAAVSLPSPNFQVTTTEDAFEFEGRGHGHGVGLCQWGARGQGLAGRTCREILSHYYPGAHLVRITGETP